MKKLLLLVAALAIITPTARMFATPDDEIDTDAITKLMKANDIDAIRKKFSEKVIAKFVGQPVRFVNSDVGNDYFMLALEYGTPEMVTLFLDKGFHLNRFNSAIIPQTPLIVAARSGNQPVVKLLLDKGADTTVMDWMAGKTAADLAKDSATRKLIINAQAANVSSSAALAPGQGAEPTEMETQFTEMDTSE